MKPLDLATHVQRLRIRLDELAERLEAPEPVGPGETLWGEYLETAQTLAGLLAVSPDGTEEHGPDDLRAGGLITTGELARRMGCSPKTILRRRKEGTLIPVIARGKHLRWSPQTASMGARR